MCCERGHGQLEPAEGEAERRLTVIFAVHRSHSALGDPFSAVASWATALAAAAAAAAAATVTRSASSAFFFSTSFLASSFFPSATTSSALILSTSTSLIVLAFFSASSPFFLFSSIILCFSLSSFSACLILLSIELHSAAFLDSNEATSVA
jgi:hypothetical protein